MYKNRTFNKNTKICKFISYKNFLGNNIKKIYEQKIIKGFMYFDFFVFIINSLNSLYNNSIYLAL